jgi:hypothetical protein
MLGGIQPGMGDRSSQMTMTLKRSDLQVMRGSPVEWTGLRRSHAIKGS